MAIKKYQTGGTALLSGPIQAREYVPLPYAEAFEMQRLNEADRATKEQGILNMYKGFYDTAMQAPPNMQDEALAEIRPYLDRIEQGLAEAGGDPLRYRGGMDVMKSFYTDMATGRIGSLQQAGSQYAATKKEYDKLNELHMKGKGGVPESISNLNLQVALQKMQADWDAGKPAVFSPPNLVEHVNVLDELGSWLSQKKTDGFTDSQGNKIEQITSEALLPMAKNYMMMDDRTRGSITQEIDLNMAAGNYPMDNVNMDEILKDKTYAKLYNDAITAMPLGLPEDQAQALASQQVYRAKLLDDRLNDFAIAAIQPFLQTNIDQSGTGTPAEIDPFLAGSATQRIISNPNNNIENLRAAKENLQGLYVARNMYAKGSDKYNEINKQVEFAENEIKASEKSVKMYARDLITASYKKVGESEEYDRITKGLSGDEKLVANLLSVTELGTATNIAVGGSPLVMGTGTVTTADDGEGLARSIKSILRENKDVVTLNPNIVNKNNAGKINRAARELQVKTNKIENATEYEQNIRSLLPNPMKGDQDPVLALSKMMTDAVVKGTAKFVDPSTGGDLTSILKESDASLTPIVSAKGLITTPGVEVMPTASFVDGKQLYAVSYHKNKWKEGEPRQDLVYVTEAEYSPQDQTNRINSLAQNLLQSNNPANQEIGINLLADNSIGGPLQRTEIEYLPATQRGMLPEIFKYAGEVSYVDRPVTGIPGVATVRRVDVGTGIYDYYILNSAGIPFYNAERTDLLTSRSLLDLGRIIYQGL